VTYAIKEPQRIIALAPLKERKERGTKEDDGKNVSLLKLFMTYVI